MGIKPVFLFAFANDEANSLRLDAEWREAELALQQAADAGRLVFNLTPMATPEDLWQKFHRFHGAISLFHYGGHSDPNQLYLHEESLKGQSLATLLGLEPNLKLVFLNACKNAGQVADLFAAGVPAVIATSEYIADSMALSLARHFYSGLAQGRTLESAFLAAAAFVNRELQLEVGIHHALPPAISEEQFAWGLYVQQAEVLQWQIPHATSP
ncbi:MAG: CHAT domain-containing protein [Bacteroidota bacterium]